jgi:hypothetical protein
MRRRRPKPEPPPQRTAVKGGYPPDVHYPEDEWRYLGEIDPRTGEADVDYSKASRWEPFREFLAERNGLPWWLSG